MSKNMREFILSTFDDSSWPNALASKGQGGIWSYQPYFANRAK